jgi:hypothetical protein
MNNTKINYESGDQIAYIPYHANGDINHGDVQFGFVTSTRELRNGEIGVWCRYYYRDGTRRTTSCSERCSPDQIVPHVSRPQEDVTAWLKDIAAEEQISYLDVWP